MLLELYKNSVFVYVIIVGLVGVYKWRHQPKSYWTFFPFFLIILGICDGIGIYFAKNGQIEISQIIYIYLIIPVEIIFYLWLFSKDISGNKTIFKTGISLFLLSIFIEFYFKEGISEFSFSSFSYLIGNLIMLINILVFFFDMSKSNRIMYFQTDRMFWITLGLLIFWLGALPYYGLFNFLNSNYYNILETYCWFVMTFNYIMYTFFIFAFLWGKKS
jgi:hypothetical protein